jgi:phosphate-selective porin
MKLTTMVAIAIVSACLSAQAQIDTLGSKKESKKEWYQNFAIRGYMQVRYNKLFETNSNLGCEQCDRSWGGEGGFFIRRMRIIFFGQISKQVYFYVQPDFVSSPSADRLHFAQIRDAYFDVGLDPDNEFRFRIGQSKVPYGFENMQSSQNRLALDRNDALNSAVSNERDLGVFFYWAPKHIRQRFSYLVNSGLKGSGDYGVIGLGAYNGQTANNVELNSEPHLVGRISYPFELKNKQIIEAGIQGYYGKTVLPTSNLSTVSGRTVKTTFNRNYEDRRVAASFIVYPQPFGITAEYTMGQGPKFNKTTDSIETSDLEGGYIMANYMLKHKNHIFIPFVRAQYFDGGKKHERDARSYLVKELEIGVEWQPVKNFELVAMYTISDRTYEDFSRRNNRQTGNLLRLQAQVNF